MGCDVEEEGIQRDTPVPAKYSSVTDIVILRFFWNKSSGVDVTDTGSGDRSLS